MIRALLIAALVAVKIPTSKVPIEGGNLPVWQWVNWGSITRQDRDGKWSYAAPAWDQMIRSFIAQHTTQ